MVEIGGVVVPDTILVGLISLAAGIAGTYLGAILKFQNDLRVKYDEDLRKMRICAYQKLWELTEPFARYSAPGPVTHDKLREISSNMRRWYFEIGGWLLSAKCRDSYFSFQNEIKVELEKYTKIKSDALDNDVLKELMTKSSTLRTSICKDIGTRAKPIRKDKD